MSRVQLIKLLFRKPAAITSGVLAIIGLYDLFVGQLIKPEMQDQFPNMADLAERLKSIGFPWLPWFVWFIIALIVIIFFMFKATYQLIDQYEDRLKTQYEEPPELIWLSELRKIGVKLREKGNGLRNPKEVDNWIDEYSEWENEVLENMKALSPTKANIWHVLDRFPSISIPYAVNAEHRKYLEMLEEKIKRLKEDIEEIYASMRFIN